MSRLLGEKDITLATKSEVETSINSKLPEIIVRACSVAGIEDNISLRDNQDQTMYRLKRRSLALLKDISPKAIFSINNGGNMLELDDMPVINLATGYHHGGISLVSREFDLTYETIKAIRYHEYSATHTEEMEEINRYAVLSLAPETEQSNDAADAINWGNRGRVQSHQETMQLMEDWFQDRVRGLSTKDKILWRLKFAAWKLFEARAISSLLYDTNREYFDRNGNVEAQYKSILDRYEKTQKALASTERALQSSPIRDIT